MKSCRICPTRSERGLFSILISILSNLSTKQKKVPQNGLNFSFMKALKKMKARNEQVLTKAEADSGRVNSGVDYASISAQRTRAMAELERVKKLEAKMRSKVASGQVVAVRTPVLGGYRISYVNVSDWEV